MFTLRCFTDNVNFGRSFMVCIVVIFSIRVTNADSQFTNFNHVHSRLNNAVFFIVFYNTVNYWVFMVKRSKFKQCLSSKIVNLPTEEPCQFMKCRNIFIVCSIWWSFKVIYRLEVQIFAYIRLSSVCMFLNHAKTKGQRCADMCMIHASYSDVLLCYL